MFEIGNSLREARVRRGLDFAQAELATKIRGKYQHVGVNHGVGRVVDELGLNVVPPVPEPVPIALVERPNVELLAALLALSQL